MPNPSNIYAEKILNEHPLVMWSLDDSSDYISLISDSFRNINSWTITNGTKASVSDSTAPFPTSYTTRINGASSSGTTGLVSASTFNSDSEGFTVGFYIKTNTDVDIRVGYTGTTQTQTVKASMYPQNTWIPVSFTFFSQATNKNLIIDLIYASANTTYDINGLTIGKNSEQFNGESLGQSLISLPSTISTTQTSGIESKSYGSQEYSAYYIGNGNNLFAKNAGMSLSYGSGNSMIVYPNIISGQPSFIFPGLGFLNDTGRYKEITLEFLIRINAKNNIPKRIIGPLASKDGIYITKEFISLKIGDSIGSYFISELYKPMILQIKFGNGYAILSIDGEDVINLNIENVSLSLPNKLDNLSKQQDWIGLYAYSDVPFFEIDLIAIYPYKSSNTLAKRRLVFAQGVEVPVEINTKYGGSSILADFSFSNYANNYNYPSFQADWSQAVYLENINATNIDGVYIQSYPSPNIITSVYSKESFLKDLYETNTTSGESDTFISLIPSSVVSGSNRDWIGSSNYIEINSYNRLECLSNCIYGIFKSKESSSSEQVLFKIFNKLNNNHLKVIITNTTVSYIFYYNNVKYNLMNQSITQDSMFAVGLDLKSLAAINPNISEFLSNTNILDIHVGGGINEATFSGNIYKVGMCSLANFQEIESLFSYGLLTNTSSCTTLISKTVSYTLNPINIYESILIDIASKGYWHDYVPLSKLAKPITNSSGNQVLDLDFVQINIDYPEPEIFADNNFNTSNSLVKTYISFQLNSSGCIKKSSEFLTTVSANQNRVIDASIFDANSKYEFVNGMIIYPPKDVDFLSLSIVIHIEISSDAINLKPIIIRSLQLAAQSFNALSKNPIGTKYAVNLYPYKIVSDNYDYKAKNPYLVYKGNSPYLYLTKQTGIKICGDYSSSVDRGLYAEVGNSSSSIQVNLIQTSIFANIKEFPTTGMKIFSLEGNASTINFYIKSFNSAKTKGIIYTDSTDNVPIYYINGKLVASPVINLNEWDILSISLVNPVDLSNSIGRLKMTSNLLLDNISFYGVSGTELGQKTQTLLWSDIDNGQWNSLTNWGYQIVLNYYKVSGSNAKEIYKIYTGTNKVVADVYSDSTKLILNKYEYIGYMNMETNTIVLDIL